MKKHLITVSVLALLAAAPAQAACYADYKAKKDNPLRLHYGVIELPDGVCDDPAKAEKQISQRISDEGWKLLNVLGTFGEDGLSEREDSAGEYYLRY